MKQLSFGAVLVGACLLVSNFFVQGEQTNVSKADCIIFSYNRPLQLYALLESMEKYIINCGEQVVIYRADVAYSAAYEKVADDFKRVRFVKQGEKPKEDFKRLTIAALHQGQAPYIMFAVDDIVVKEPFDCAVCVDALEKHSAYGFYLRMGKNLSECYPFKCKQGLPALQELDSVTHIYSWQFNKGSLDWAYPNTVDMTIYKKADISSDLQTVAFHAPNTLEGAWHGLARKVMNKKGLCFHASKMVNLPLNRVQNEYNNRAMDQLSPQDLLALFNQDKKMAIEPLHAVNNKAAHMEYTPIFISRERIVS